jgi:hypothetical protein
MVVERSHRARRDFQLTRGELSDLAEFCSARIAVLKAISPSRAK